MRKVLIVFIALAAVVAGAAVFVVLPSDGGGPAASSKQLNALAPTTASSFRTFLEVEGRSVGAVSVLAYGGPVGVVQTISQQPPSKHMTSVAYPDVVVEVPATSTSAIAPWVAETWSGTASRRNITLVETDAYLKVLRRTDFQDVALVGVRVPDLDAASNEQVRFRLTMRPSVVRVGAGDGSGYSSTSSRQQSLLSSGLRLTMAGQVLRATKVEAIDVTSEPAAAAEGDARLMTKSSTLTAFPNVRVVLGATHVADLRRQYTDSVLQGSEGPREDGRLEFMAADGSPSGLALDLHQCGIMRLDSIPTVGEEIAKVLAEFYCNSMAFVAPRP